MNYNIYDIAFSVDQSITPIEKKALLDKYKSSEEVLKLSTATLKNLLGRRWSGKRYNPQKFIEYAKNITGFLQRANIKTVTIYDENYPYGLKEIPDSPFLLYYKGNIEFKYSQSIAIVGTRKPTDLGRRYAIRFTNQLIDKNYTIVSGLALGIDSISHETCVNNQAKTIAVLGCGIDRIYPAANKNIARKIIETDGAIISEYPPGIPPNRWNFPKRNRIIVGLVRGVIIIQSPEKSGSLISAYLSTDYNRDLFVAEPEVKGESFEGNRQLILQGAMGIKSVDVIFNEWAV